MNSKALLQTLRSQCHSFIEQAESLKTLDQAILTQKQSPESWSVLECVEHLNLYGDYYLPEIERKISQSATKPEGDFKSGMLGNYFAQSMLPKEKLNKMKTFKDKNPLHAQLDPSVIDRFIAQQRTMLKLLDQAEKVSLNRVKIATSISRLIQLKLGDALMFINNHIIRHFQQIENTKRAVQTLSNRKLSI